MTETVAMDVRLPPRREPRSKWERDHDAFLDMLPALLATHRGKYVAVHNGAIASVGDDPVAVAIEAYGRHGYGPIHVGLVTDRPPPPIRLPSPRFLRSMGQVYAAEEEPHVLLGCDVLNRFRITLDGPRVLCEFEPPVRP